MAADEERIEVSCPHMDLDFEVRGLIEDGMYIIQVKGGTARHCCAATKYGVAGQKR